MERKKKVTKVQEKTYYELCEQFMVERGLDKQKADFALYTTNVLEELFEGFGLDRTSAKQNSKSLYKQIFKPLEGKFEVNLGIMADSASDIKVFSNNMQYNLDLDPEKADKETCKEILSREGSLNSEGRFVKDMSEEAQAKWYSADYESCKRK